MVRSLKISMDQCMFTVLHVKVLGDQQKPGNLLSLVWTRWGDGTSKPAGSAMNALVLSQ